MRRTFFKLLHEAMSKDPRIILFSGDLGYSLIEPIRDDFPGRFFNMQAAEFCMVGAMLGWAYEGYIPVGYSISPFITLRPLELLRTYANHECTPIRLVGAGRGDQYQGGISHYAGDVTDFLDPLGNIEQFWPQDETELTAMMQSYLHSANPTFLSLSK